MVLPQKPEWGVNGESIQISVDATSTVAQMKEAIAAKLPDGANYGPGKQNPKIGSKHTHPELIGFAMKNASTVASYNLKSGDEIVAGIRERGGKK